MDSKKQKQIDNWYKVVSVKQIIFYLFVFFIVFIGITIIEYYSIPIGGIIVISSIIILIIFTKSSAP